MILRPQRNFTVVRQIGNHTDTSTYYVRAVIRDAYTDVILATLNLTDQGSQRFTKNWQVAADPSGMGREISIVTSVYSNSGYTTKSENYGDEENSHMIEDNLPMGRGGGGIDARTLRRVLEDVIGVKEEEKPTKKEKVEVVEQKKETPTFDNAKIFNAIKSLEKTIASKEIKPTDLKPIIKGMDILATMIADKEVTPATDLSPILERFEEIEENDSLTREEMLELIEGLRRELVTQLPKVIAALLTQATFKIEPTTATIKLPEPKQKEEEGIPFDINALTT